MTRLISILGILFLLSNSIQAQENLIFSKPKGTPNGDLVAIVVKEAYQRIGISIGFKELPLKRSLVQSNRGKTDGELYRNKVLQKKLNNLIMIPISVNKVEFRVFTKGLQFEVKGWESLKPYKIGIVRGIAIIEEKTQGMDTYSLVSLKHLFQFLDKGRADVAVFTYVDSLALLKKLKGKISSNIQALSPPLDVATPYHFIHKKHRALVPKIQKSLEDMEREGRIAQIREAFIKTILERN